MIISVKRSNIYWPSQTTVIALLFLLFPLFGFGQENLVLNHSFEEYTHCPISLNEVNFPCKYWLPDIPVWSTPDYYNKCASDTLLGVPYNFSGYCQPKTGNAYVGLILMVDGDNSMEHIRGKLRKPLQEGHKYTVSFYTKLAYQFSDYATYNIGAFLSRDSNVIKDNYYTDGMNPELSPSVSNGTNFIKDTNWVKISGIYIALGGEKYITLGLFWDNTPQIVKVWGKCKGAIKLGNVSINRILKKYMFCNNVLEEKKYVNDRSKLGKPLTYYFIDDVSVIDTNN